MAAVAGAVLLALAGCSAGQAPAAPAPVDAAESEHAAGLPTAAPASPTWSDDAAADAWWTALAAMGEFAHPERAAEDWYERLAGYLTANAQVAFHGTDPAAVPVRTVGEATVAEGGSPFLAEVIVGTDAGPYRLLLVREGADRPFRVERLEPAR